MKFNYSKTFTKTFLCLIIIILSVFVVIRFDYYKNCIFENKCCYDDLGSNEICQDPYTIEYENGLTMQDPGNVGEKSYTKMFFSQLILSILLSIVPAIFITIIIKWIKELKHITNINKNKS